MSLFLLNKLLPRSLNVRLCVLADSRPLLLPALVSPWLLSTSTLWLKSCKGIDDVGVSGSDWFLRCDGVEEDIASARNLSRA